MEYLKASEKRLSASELRKDKVGDKYPNVRLENRRDLEEFARCNFGKRQGKCQSFMTEANVKDNGTSRVMSNRMSEDNEMTTNVTRNVKHVKLKRQKQK